MQSKKLPMRNNFSWTLVGNTLFSFSQWGIVVVLAKLGSPDILGKFALANAITAPVFMFGSMDLGTVQTSDIKNPRLFSEYLGLRVVLSVLSLVVITGLLWLSKANQEILTITALTAICRFVEAISDVTYGLLQKEERLDLVARSLVLRGIIPLFTIATSLFIFHDLSIALISQLITWIAILVFFDLPNARQWQEIRPRFYPRVLMSIFLLALPLGIVSGLNSLSSQVPRYTIEHYGSEHELGIFTAIISLSAIASLITTSLSRSALPRLSQLYAAHELHHFVKLLQRLMISGATVGVIGFLGSLVFGKFFLAVAYTEEYAAYADILTVSMINVGITATFTFVGTALGATRRFAVQAPIHIVKLTAITFASILFIPNLNAIGAVLALIIGSLTSGIIYSCVLWRTIYTEKQRISESFHDIAR